MIKDYPGVYGEKVAPRTGAWVAINWVATTRGRYGVAPRTGAWVAILKKGDWKMKGIGRSSYRSVGCNFNLCHAITQERMVAPRTGAWVAICHAS